MDNANDNVDIEMMRLNMIIKELIMTDETTQIDNIAMLFDDMVITSPRGLATDKDDTKINIDNIDIDINTLGCTPNKKKTKAKAKKKPKPKSKPIPKIGPNPLTLVMNDKIDFEKMKKT